MCQSMRDTIPQWLEEVSQGETVFEEVDELECDAGEGQVRRHGYSWGCFVSATVQWTTLS